MSPRKGAALLFALAACAALCSTSHADSKNSSEEPFICIVIRTYWGHGRYGELSLAKLINSLKAQSHQRCVQQARQHCNTHALPPTPA
jgi:hypothetical protein